MRTKRLACGIAGLFVLALFAMVSAGLPAPASAAPDPNSLEVRLSGSGHFDNYWVTSSVGGIDDGKIRCGSRFGGGTHSCMATYEPGTEVTLTADVHNPRRERFVAWGGACEAFGQNPVCTVTIGNAAFVWARFDEDGDDPSILFVSKTGNGTGNVSSEVARIDCGPNCLGMLPDDYAVTLTATPDNGSRFVRWDGACSGSDRTCVISPGQGGSGGMELATVRAIFELKPNLLFINKTGDGRGSVSSEPNGISCGVDCVSEFAWGTEVTLSAAAEPGSKFTGWSGACGTVVGKSCRVTVSTLRWVQAHFVPHIAKPPVGAAFSALKVTPKIRIVRSGKPAVFRVRVKNSGGTRAAATRICLKAPKRLVRGKRCVKVGGLAAGRIAKVKFRLRTTKKAKRNQRIKLVFNANARAVAGKTGRATLWVR